MTKREQVARAIWGDCPEPMERWDELHPDVRRAFLKMADAAINAMRGPTAGMVEAARSGAPYEFVRGSYDAMIDAALKDPTDV